MANGFCSMKWTPNSPKATAMVLRSQRPVNPQFRRSCLVRSSPPLDLSRSPRERMAVLKQNHNEFDQHTVLHTVMMGHRKLWEHYSGKGCPICQTRFQWRRRTGWVTWKKGIEMNGWNAESDAAELQGVTRHQRRPAWIIHERYRRKRKVRCWLHRLLYGNPGYSADGWAYQRPSILIRSRGGEFPGGLWEYRWSWFPHDRHFLDAVCAHVADIDYGKITIFTGNYSVLVSSSRGSCCNWFLQKNKKLEDKRKEVAGLHQPFSVPMLLKQTGYFS